MSELDFYWNENALCNSRNLFFKATNILNDNRKIINDLKGKLNVSLNKNK